MARSLKVARSSVPTAISNSSRQVERGPDKYGEFHPWPLRRRVRVHSIDGRSDLWVVALDQGGLWGDETPLGLLLLSEAGDRRRLEASLEEMLHALAMSAEVYLIEDEIENVPVRLLEDDYGEVAVGYGFLAVFSSSDPREIWSSSPSMAGTHLLLISCYSRQL